MEIEALYKHTKIKADNDINNSDDVQIKLVKFFQKKNEDTEIEIIIQGC